MATPDGRFQIVFNGEIYNYRALRADLQARGERFATGSDTEVLLRLVSRGGPARLADVRGMFAFACWDRVERSLLCRPRPLRHQAAVRRGRLRAASRSHRSSARSARRNSTGGETSPAGILAFLQWGSVPPPLTWQRGVEMLEPGTWRRWWLDGREERGVFADARAVYACDVDSRRAAAAGHVEAFRAEVAPAVRESVRAHLVADVPVGVFLSGGIDSGALVSCAASVGAANLQTFTVGFDDESSEVERARAVADAVRHHAPRAARGPADDRARTAGRALASRSADDRRRELVLRLARGGRDRHQGRAVRRRRRRALRRLPVVQAAAAGARGQAVSPARSGRPSDRWPAHSCPSASGRVGGISPPPTAT